MLAIFVITIAAAEVAVGHRPDPALLPPLARRRRRPLRQPLGLSSRRAGPPSGPTRSRCPPDATRPTAPKGPSRCHRTPSRRSTSATSSSCARDRPGGLGAARPAGRPRRCFRRPAGPRRRQALGLALAAGRARSLALVALAADLRPARRLRARPTSLELRRDRLPREPRPGPVLRHARRRPADRAASTSCSSRCWAWSSGCRWPGRSPRTGASTSPCCSGRPSG